MGPSVEFDICMIHLLVLTSMSWIKSRSNAVIFNIDIRYLSNP